MVSTWRLPHIGKCCRYGKYGGLTTIVSMERIVSTASTVSMEDTVSMDALGLDDVASHAPA